MILGSFFIKLGVKNKNKNKNKNINEYKSFNAFGLQCFCNILF